MFKTIVRQSFRLRPMMNVRLTTPLAQRMHTLSSGTQLHGNTWSSIFVVRRTSMMDQIVKDAGQMRSQEPMTPRDLENRVLKICSDYDKIQESQKTKLTLETHFMNDLGLDSLDHVEIIVALENEFGFEIPDVDYDKLYTIKSVVDYLSKKMNVTGRPKSVLSSSPDPRHEDHH